jgi:hypothetical protein
MPATDPISKTVACQFGIDPVDFGFEVGSNLNPPTEPGVGNLIKLVIDAILATFVFFLTPLNYILEGKIPDLLDWISTAMSDPEQFVTDAFVMLYVDPYVQGLQVSVPSFELEGVPIIGSLTIPDINPGKPGFDDNPQWTGQIPGFLSLFIGILLLPIKLFEKIFTSIVEKLSIPVVGKPLLDEIWELIVPGLGLPTVESQDVVIRFGQCLTENVEPLIPPLFAAGASPPGPPPDISVSIVSGPSISYNGEYSFDGTAQTVSVRFQRNSSDYDIESISLINGTETPLGYFTMSSGPFSLTSSTPTVDVPLSLTVNGRGTVRTATVQVKITSPTQDAFIFSVKSFTKNPIEILMSHIREQTPVYPGSSDKRKYPNFFQPIFDSVVALLKSVYDVDTWDPQLNIFGIRKEEVGTDQFEDIIGIAYYNIPTAKWDLYAFKGTTRPTAYWRNFLKTDPNRNPKGADTIKTGFYPSMWSRGTHPVPPSGPNQPNSLVMNFAGAPLKHCITWRDKNGNGTKDPNDPSLLGNLSFNCHYPGPSYSESSTPSSMGQASAGCQVLQSKTLYQNVFSPLVYDKTDLIRIPNRYAYCLFLKERVQDLWDAISPYDNSWTDGLVGSFEV